MRTEIFKDVWAFYGRPDQTVNGVSESFAAANVGWDEERGNTGCWNCSGCSDCSDCSDCSRCSRCSRCSGCSGCSGCSDCSDCSGCSRCSDCSREINAISKRGTVQPSSIVPVIENIHAKVLAAASATPDSLDMGGWHTCESTHCRGGWVVTLAGEAGKALEAFHNTELAAYLIYQASSPIRVPFPRFYATNDVAMADMQRCAEEEKNLAGSAA